MDLQTVKVGPYLNGTSFYFKAKLACHKFTVYNVTCHRFTEIYTNLDIFTFESGLLAYTKNMFATKPTGMAAYSKTGM